MLLSSGCGANALNSTRSSALHVAVQRGFLEVVKVLCEHGCDVNLPVSAGSPGSGPGVKEVMAETSLPSHHWPTTGRMPMLIHPCTAPSQRALVPAALWRSSPRCQASTSLPPTARASLCCTMRPSKATHCEFGVTHSSCCATGPPWVAPDPRGISLLPQSCQEDSGAGAAAGGRQEGGWVYGTAPGRLQQPRGGGPGSHPRGVDRVPWASDWGVRAHQGPWVEPVPTPPQGHCDVNARNRKLQSPLHLAVQQAHVGLVPLLVDAGCSVNAEDEEGDTALHVALQRHQLLPLAADGSAGDPGPLQLLSRVRKRDSGCWGGGHRTGPQAPLPSLPSGQPDQAL